MPGPGYYNIDSRGVEIKKYGIGTFGGYSMRFENNYNTTTSARVGPGSYGQEDLPKV